MKIGAYTVVVKLTSGGGDLGVAVSGDRLQMATWIDPKRFAAYPRYAAFETVEQVVEACRARVPVAELAEAIEAECRKALGMEAS